MSDMSELPSKLLMLMSNLITNQIYRKKVYSKRMFIEIIVIIVKEHL